MKDLREALDRRRAERLYRSRPVVDTPQGPEIVVDGRPLLAFCSNDYLGLAADPRLAEALAEGARRYGTGSGAAHLVTGHSTAHHALEEELAEFTGRDRAVLFSTGYMANLGVVGALCGAGDAVFQDRLNHASLLDAGVLSRARLQRYAHADPHAAAMRLSKSRANRRLLVTDGVFSMDGDIAPLPQLAAVAERHGAWLMVDDAHGLGVLGGGRGSTAHHGLDTDAVPIVVGTLGKAFGTFGAFVAGSETLAETVIQFARSYIYTTAMPPAVAEATRASVRIVRDEGWRRDHLDALVARLREGFAHLGLPVPTHPTPIQPLVTGDAASALALHETLLAAGILVSAIRPPTVPEGTARLRITLSAAHRMEHVDRLIDALAAHRAWLPENRQ